MAVDIDCVLLAGGSSRRMGKPKLLLRLGNRTLFEHVLAAHLESSVRRICAVVPGWLKGFEEVIEGRASGRVGFAPLSRECEMSQSLKTGWKFVMQSWQPDAVMISLADKPLVTPELIEQVIRGFAESGHSICVPVFDGQRGHPVILTPGLEGEVYALEGDRGAGSIIEAHRGSVCEVPVDSDGILADIDTYDDFDDLRRRLNTEGTE